MASESRFREGLNCVVRGTTRGVELLSFSAQSEKDRAGSFGARMRTREPAIFRP